MDETKLLDEKKMKDMKEVLFDTKKLITKHTDTIPTIEPVSYTHLTLPTILRV